MAVTCRTADAPALVRYAFEGDWTARDFLDRRRELLQAGQLTARSAVLLDLRQSATCPPLDDLDPALYASTSAPIWPACRAYLIATEAQYECARQIQALLGPRPAISEIFQNETNAIEWLSAMAGRSQGSGPGPTGDSEKP